MAGASIAAIPAALRAGYTDLCFISGPESWVGDTNINPFIRLITPPPPPARCKELFWAFDFQYDITPLLISS